MLPSIFLEALAYDMVRNLITNFVIPSDSEESLSRSLYDQSWVGFLVASRLEMTAQVMADKSCDLIPGSV